MITLLIPVFNEELAIAETVERAQKALKQTGEDFTILVINDGSSDNTEGILNSLDIPELKVVTHHVNQGYGASMKTGIRNSQGTYIATTDADGTYPLEDLPKLYAIAKEKDADMVVGARTKKGAQIPLIRKPAKWFIARLVNYVTSQRVPDNNSGLRVFTRDLAEKYMHLYPQGFSFTITITLAALTNNYVVLYEPIDYFKRKGSSSLSAGFNGIKNFLGFIHLIVRITTYFRPLKFFTWPAILLLGSGIGLAAKTIVTDANISDAGLLLIVTGIQIGLFGLLAEVIVRHRAQ